MAEKSKDEARLERKRRLAKALKANLSRRKVLRRKSLDRADGDRAGPENKTDA
jgi:hypothetical protein